MILIGLDPCQHTSCWNHICTTTHTSGGYTTQHNGPTPTLNEQGTRLRSKRSLHNPRRHNYRINSRSISFLFLHTKNNFATVALLGRETDKQWTQSHHQTNLYAAGPSHRMQVGKVKPWHTKKRAMYTITRRRSINAALQKEEEIYEMFIYFADKRLKKQQTKENIWWFR